ncbi:hypothetical protein BDB01DRAFT_854452 [Pilobolus umbonatus]|nr:hypothetical protein BDB01DRAFT_854452 [Pilobolus umbonatus]
MTEDKKRKHKDSSEKKSKKKHKATIVSSSAPTPTTSTSFSEVVVKLYFHLAPIWSGKTMEGINDQLNAFLMKNVPEVDGIILAHSDVKLLTEKGGIINDSPFAHFFITVKFLVWKPKKGTKLVGRINLQSEDHIGLLIYGTFNASIPKSRIPASKYEWKFNEETEIEEPVVGDEEEDSEEDAGALEIRKRTQYGEWINKETGQSITSDEGTLEFSVVDIIEATDVLTVTGSL